MKKVIIIAAGLTAAYELLSKSGGYDVTIFEETDVLGLRGIAPTLIHFPVTAIAMHSLSCSLKELVVT